MNVIEATAALLFDADAYRRTVAELDAMTAERDAALQRVAALEEQLQRMDNERKFYLDVIAVADAARRAQRQRVTL